MFLFFFFNDTATTEIYTLSLHDALPICGTPSRASAMNASTWLAHHPQQRSSSSPRTAIDCSDAVMPALPARRTSASVDRKSTRLNSSHANISYAVFCLKKKKILKSTSYL